MKIWMIAREYDGIAEAGGVKNVVCSLSEELSKSDNEITLFIPQYGCTEFSRISELKELTGTFDISCNEKNFSVSFSQGYSKKVRVIFVKADIYSEKQNVYTYNQKDRTRFPDCQVGTGYCDALYLDVLFQKAVCSYAEAFQDVPEVVHCHDACVAAFPAIAKVLYPNVFKDAKMVVSIHNAGPAYHHEFADLQQAKSYTGLPSDILASSLNGQRVEPYVLATHYAKLSTVSYDYAQELVDPDNHNTDGLSEIFASRKVPIYGITNGIDIKRYSPEDKNISRLPFEFSPERMDLAGKYQCRKFFIENYAVKGNAEISFPDGMIKQSGYLEPDEENKNIYISFHGRLVRQKGILVILDLIDRLFASHPDVCLIINGQGETFLEEELSKKARQHAGRMVYLCGYDRGLARLCTASGDFALFPSEFEPCGLEDFIAQIYGTIPVAHGTGGLKKIVNGTSGFTYSPNNAEVLLSVLDGIIANKNSDSHYYDELIKSAACYVRDNYTWQTVCNQKYIPYYRS